MRSGTKAWESKSQEKQRVTDLIEGLVQLHSLQANARVRWIGKMGLAGQMGTWRPILRAFVVDAGLMDFVCFHRK